MCFLNYRKIIKTLDEGTRLWKKERWKAERNRLGREEELSGMNSDSLEITGRQKKKTNFLLPSPGSSEKWPEKRLYSGFTEHENHFWLGQRRVCINLEKKYKGFKIWGKSLGLVKRGCLHMLKATTRWNITLIKQMIFLKLGVFL